MSLVVYSNEELETLEKYVTGLFEKVRNRDIGLVSYESLPDAYTSKQLQKILKIKTTKKTRKLSLKFMVPSMKKEFKTNIFGIVSFLIGHEGKGSLLSTLIEEGLALELGSANLNTLDYFTQFLVEITLTEKGLTEYERIIQIFFHYVSILRKEGLSENLFEEIKAIQNLKFEFRSKMDGMMKAMEVADALSSYPPEYVNKIPFLMEEYLPERFLELLDFLTPANLIVNLKNHELENMPLKEHYYGTEYSNEGLNFDLVDKIFSILKGSPYF